MKKPELLSPAGNFYCLEAAIEAGCDAVYLGGYTFGARNYAGNFSNEEIVKAIKYAHLYGVKVYVTVNTMIYENETEMFINYIDFLHRNQVDAIIIQDLGMMDYVRKVYPNLEIHASTQMNIHNIEGVKLLEELGVKRVVLAREVSFSMIEKIKKETNIEIESFIHGALCFSYSGNCLMSSLLGGRSGNRGTCTQCCRMPYSLISNHRKVNKEDYVLSTRDLNTIFHIGKLIELGIDSFKIEGRMKKPEYVYVITKLYRKAIDNYLKNKKIEIDESDILEMKQLFHRKFTKGFLLDEKIEEFMNPTRPNHQGIQIGKVIKVNPKSIEIKLEDTLNQNDGIRILNKKEDQGCIVEQIYINKNRVKCSKRGEIITIPFHKPVSIHDVVMKTTDSLKIKEIKEKIQKKGRKVPLIGRIIIKKNEPILLELNDFNNQLIVRGDILVEESKTSPITRQKVYEQINKLGDTVFQFQNLTICMEENVFIPIKELNEIRRKSILKLIEKREKKIPYQTEPYSIELKDYHEKFQRSIQIYDERDYEKIKNQKFDVLYIEEENSYLKIKDDRKVFRLSRIINTFEKRKGDLLISDLGSLYTYTNIITDFSFNVANSYTVAFLHSMGAKRVTLSYELTDEQIKDIIDAYQKRYQKKPSLELIVKSTPEVMITKYPLLKSYNVQNGYLEDKYHNRFKIKENKDYTTIYHCKKIERSYQKYEKMGIQNIRFIEE